ncbi:MAG: anaerobic ribonucleoside-triphosphate reductase activating protein [bacterium]
MHLSGLIKSSLIDYPGKVAAVVFTQGCNFRCGFCHNPDLIPIKPGLISEEEIFKHLEKRKDILDGVVITGGEPLIQRDIVSFIRKIKDMGLLVKIDTNGSNPKILDTLLSQGLVDYIAMDIKGPLKNYSNISGYLNNKFIQESIDLLLGSKTEYEFRTTVLPYYHSLNDFEDIGKLIKGANKYVVQGFRPDITYNQNLRNELSFSLSEMEQICQIMKKHVKNVVLYNNLST